MARSTVRLWAFALLILSAGPAASAPLANLDVPAGTNVFAAGRSDSSSVGGGAVPLAVPLPTGPGVVLNFAVTGADVSCCGTADPHGPQGSTGLQTFISSAGGISGIRHLTRNIFLTGVFLGPATPSDPAPVLLAFYDPADTTAPPAGALSTEAPEVFPLLHQTFFIGDGFADGLVPQSFHAPAGATRLFLGYADGLNLGDPRLGTPSPAAPGFYGDNTGSLSVEVSTLDVCTARSTKALCQDDCCAAINAADRISTRAMAGETHFSRNDYLLLFKAVECRTGVPSRYLRTISFSEGLGNFYADPYPRQFVEPCEGAFNEGANAWFFTELFSRYYGRGNDAENRWPLLGFGLLPALFGQQTLTGAPSVPNPANPESCVLPPPPSSQPAWRLVWPGVVHVTIGNDRPDNAANSNTFGLGVMQLTFHVDAIGRWRGSLPLNSTSTVLRERLNRGSGLIYPVGGARDGNALFNLEGLPDLVRVVKDPQFNILLAAELVLFKWQFGSPNVVRPDAADLFEVEDQPPYGRVLKLQDGVTLTEDEWVAAVAQIKTFATNQREQWCRSCTGSPSCQMQEAVRCYVRSALAPRDPGLDTICARPAESRCFMHRARLWVGDTASIPEDSSCR